MKLGMTVEDLHARMSSDEFVHWQAYTNMLAQRRELAEKAGS